MAPVEVSERQFAMMCERPVRAFQACPQAGEPVL